MATVVDHMVPHQGDKYWFEKVGNHLPLCVTCHNTVTAKFDRYYVKGDSIEPKTNWLNGERLRNELKLDKKFPSIKVIQYYGVKKR